MIWSDFSTKNRKQFSKAGRFFISPFKINLGVFQSDKYVWQSVLSIVFSARVQISCQNRVEFVVIAGLETCYFFLNWFLQCLMNRCDGIMLKIDAFCIVCLWSLWFGVRCMVLSKKDVRTNDYSGDE